MLFSKQQLGGVSGVHGGTSWCAPFHARRRAEYTAGIPAPSKRSPNWRSSRLRSVVAALGDLLIVVVGRLSLSLYGSCCGGRLLRGASLEKPGGVVQSKHRLGSSNSILLDLILVGCVSFVDVASMLRLRILRRADALSLQSPPAVFSMRFRSSSL